MNLDVPIACLLQEDKPDPVYPFIVSGSKKWVPGLK
jgi:hypothetical protein